MRNNDNNIDQADEEIEIQVHDSNDYKSKQEQEESVDGAIKYVTDDEEAKHDQNASSEGSEPDQKSKQLQDNDTSDLGSLIPKTLILTLWIVIFTTCFTFLSPFVPDIRIVNGMMDPFQAIAITFCVLLMYKSHLSTYTNLCLFCHKQIKSGLKYQ